MESTPKVNLTQRADDALDKMLQAINQDFTSGRVQKFQLVSWIVLNFEKTFSKKVIERVRLEHFDKVAHVRSILRQMEEARKADTELELDSLLSPLRTKLAAKSHKKTKANPDEN